MKALKKGKESNDWSTMDMSVCVCDVECVRKEFEQRVIRWWRKMQSMRWEWCVFEFHCLSQNNSHIQSWNRNLLTIRFLFISSTFFVVVVVVVDGSEESAQLTRVYVIVLCLAWLCHVFWLAIVLFIVIYVESQSQTFHSSRYAIECRFLPLSSLGYEATLCVYIVWKRWKNHALKMYLYIYVRNDRQQLYIRFKRRFEFYFCFGVSAGDNQTISKAFNIYVFVRQDKIK